MWRNSAKTRFVTVGKEIAGDDLLVCANKFSGNSGSPLFGISNLFGDEVQLVRGYLGGPLVRVLVFRTFEGATLR